MAGRDPTAEGHWWLFSLSLVDHRWAGWCSAWRCRTCCCRFACSPACWCRPSASSGSSDRPGARPAPSPPSWWPSPVRQRWPPSPSTGQCHSPSPSFYVDIPLLLPSFTEFSWTAFLASSRFRFHVEIQLVPLSFRSIDLDTNRFRFYDETRLVLSSFTEFLGLNWFRFYVEIQLVDSMFN